MSDRFKGLLVVLETAYKDERAMPIIEAIKMVKGVRKVEVYVARAEDYIMYQQGFFDCRRKILELLDQDPDISGMKK